MQQQSRYFRTTYHALLICGAINPVQITAFLKFHHDPVVWRLYQTQPLVDLDARLCTYWSQATFAPYIFLLNCVVIRSLKFVAKTYFCKAKVDKCYLSRDDRLFEWVVPAQVAFHFAAFHYRRLVIPRKSDVPLALSIPYCHVSEFCSLFAL